VPAWSDLVVFAGASVALLLVPGPAVLYVITRSVHQGRASGLASAAGLGIGTFVHVLAAAAGLSVVLARSATAFNVVKVAGAVYLVAIGVARLLSRVEDEAELEIRAVPLRRAFGQGVIVNVLNPKIALFFLAFLPQFIDPDRGRPAVQTVVLGATFVLLGLCTDGLYALSASALGARLRRSRRFRFGLERGSGVVFIGLGIYSALAHRPATDV
jgi:threonine/homoserine/homoserine lactone efflux protein